MHHTLANHVSLNNLFNVLICVITSNVLELEVLETHRNHFFIDDCMRLLYALTFIAGNNIFHKTLKFFPLV